LEIWYQRPDLKRGPLDPQGRSTFVRPVEEVCPATIYRACDLIEATRFNNVYPQFWLTDTLSGIAEHKTNKVDTLLLWNYKVWMDTFFLIGAGSA